MTKAADVYPWVLDSCSIARRKGWEIEYVDGGLMVTHFDEHGDDDGAEHLFIPAWLYSALYDQKRRSRWI